MSTLVIVVLLVLFMAYAVRSALKKFNSGCCSDRDTEKIKRVRVPDKDFRHYPIQKTIRIDGMHCKNCTVRVQNALNQLDGAFAKVDLSKEEAKVYLKENAPDRVLRSTILKAGYTALSITDQGSMEIN
ncbi:MAG: heavy-metal-associated domain-containing protein [Sporolactobacillus sp.]